jgi:hypothetical protein
MRRFTVLAGLATAVAGTMAFADARSSTSLTTGNLNLRATVRVVSEPAACPSGAPADAAGCRARTGKASVPGLGSVSQAYTWFYRLGPPTCPSVDVGKPLATSGRLLVAGKGEIHFALADGSRCVEEEPMRNEPQGFTITGGTGVYAAATGSGTVERSISGGFGSETWAGTLTLPGQEFDVTPPALVGARSRTARAPKGATQARVTYVVSANDIVDGKVPATCVPRSGSRFKVGRTSVKCSATDSSANTRRASFTVTVKARG